MPKENKMPNMGYVRFANTLKDLWDCYEHLDNDSLFIDEEHARTELIGLCHTIASQYKADSEETYDNDKLISPSEATMTDLSERAKQLAHSYMELVNDQEHGMLDKGFTAEELELRRTKLHNQLNEELKACRVDTKDRKATNELARRIQRWLEE